jgi:excisionase family DNA binding protein
MNVNSRKLGLTTSEAARRLGVSLSTVRRWSDMGYLRGYRTPGGQRRFSIQQLDDFVTSLEAGGPRQPRREGGAGVSETVDEPRIHRHHEELVAFRNEPAAADGHPGSSIAWPPTAA